MDVLVTVNGLLKLTSGSMHKQRNSQHKTVATLMIKAVKLHLRFLAYNFLIFAKTPVVGILPQLNSQRWMLIQLKMIRHVPL